MSNIIISTYLIRHKSFLCNYDFFRSIVIINQPQDQTVTMLDDVSFSCDAESVSTPLSHQWYFQDKVLVGQCESVLKLLKVSLDQKGQYKCVVRNSAGIFNYGHFQN